jgi:hypothetical protein
MGHEDDDFRALGLTFQTRVWNGPSAPGRPLSRLYVPAVDHSRGTDWLASNNRKSRTFMLFAAVVLRWIQGASRGGYLSVE